MNHYSNKKFCATTQVDTTAAHHSGFKAPFTLSEALHRKLHYEFIDLEKTMSFLNRNKQREQSIN